MVSGSVSAGLAQALRYVLEKTHSVSVVEVNKGTKMEMLYKYLTGKDFKNQFESMIRGFMELKSGYNTERLQMNKLWAEREKQIQKVLDSAAAFYGSIKGIAGSSVPSVKEFDVDNDNKIFPEPEDK